MRLAPASEASSDRNSFRATVRDVYFLGRIQEIQIDIDGTELRVIEVRGNTFRTGEEVLATFPEHSVILL